MAKNLLQLNKIDYEEITKLAALMFTPREVAMMLEININQFVSVCETDDNLAFTAFYKGRLQAEVDLRTSILKLAKSGSSPAQLLAIDLLNKSKQKMIDR